MQKLITFLYTSNGQKNTKKKNEKKKGRKGDWKE